MVESDKSLTTQLRTLENDDPIGKIATRIEMRKPRFGRDTIRRNSRTIDQIPYSDGDLAGRLFITSRQDPNKFAQNRQRHSDDFGFAEQSPREFGFFEIIHYRGANEEIGVRDDLHFSPAQPAAAISFISSTDNGFVPGLTKQPMKALMTPGG